MAETTDDEQTRLLEKILEKLDKSREEDLLRTLMDAGAPLLEVYKQKALSQVATAHAQELQAMLGLRNTMREFGEETADIDRRISYLMSQLKER